MVVCILGNFLNCYCSHARWLTLISLFHSPGVLSSSPPAEHEDTRPDGLSIQQAMSVLSPPAGPFARTIELEPLPCHRSKNKNITPPVPLQELGPERVSQDTAPVASYLTPPKQKKTVPPPDNTSNEAMAQESSTDSLTKETLNTDAKGRHSKTTHPRHGNNFFR